MKKGKARNKKEIKGEKKLLARDYSFFLPADFFSL